MLVTTKHFGPDQFNCSIRIFLNTSTDGQYDLTFLKQF